MRSRITWDANVSADVLYLFFFFIILNVHSERSLYTKQPPSEPPSTTGFHRVYIQIYVYYINTFYIGTFKEKEEKKIPNKYN